MLPAGVKRDKLIARLRGETIKHRSDTSYLNRTIDGLKVWHHTPHPYSTDIATAMELWGEMKADPSIFRIDLVWGQADVRFGDPPHVKKEHLYIHLYMDDGKDRPANTEGEDFADAISGAWLKWKEAE